MTEHAEHPVHQENDNIRGVAVFLVIMGTTALSVIFVFISWILWRSNEAAFHPGGLPPVAHVEVTPPEIWMINQTLINVDTAAKRMADQKRRQIDEYGWIDQAAGTARIPIDEAIRALVEEARR